MNLYFTLNVSITFPDNLKRNCNLERCWSCPRTWCKTGGGWCPCSSCSTTWGRWPRCRAARERRGSEWKPLCPSRPPFWAKVASVKPNFLTHRWATGEGAAPVKANLGKDFWDQAVFLFFFLAHSGTNKLFTINIAGKVLLTCSGVMSAGWVVLSLMEAHSTFTFTNQHKALKFAIPRNINPKICLGKQSLTGCRIMHLGNITITVFWYTFS